MARKWKIVIGVVVAFVVVACVAAPIVGILSIRGRFHAMGWPSMDRGRMVDEGATALGGRIPVNPSGGLLSKGHPLGATGVGQIVELVWQLRGECGDRQVPDADIGLTHNVGGIGQYCFVQVLRRE